MNKTENNLVSVIIPTYNRKKYLISAIESVLNQNRTGFDIELIVVDDGSTDGTEESVKRYGNKVRYKKIQHWGGPAKPRNVGIEISKGEYIAFLDSDDMWLEDKISNQLKLFSSKVGLVYSNGYFIDENNNQLNNMFLMPKQGKSGYIFDDLLMSNFIPLSSVVVRREVIEKVGNFTEDKSVGFEDYHLWLRISANYKISYCDKPLFLYRTHGQKYSQDVIESSGEETQARRVYWKLIVDKNLAISQRKKILKRLNSNRLNYYSSQTNNKHLKFVFKSIRKALRISKMPKEMNSYLNEKALIKNNIPIVASENSKKNVLFILPWMTLGGADKVALDIAMGLKEEFNWHFITTEPENDNSWHDQFLQVTNRIHHISDLIKFQNNKSTYIYLYCTLNKIDTIIMSNSVSGYRALPMLRKKLKNLKIIDVLHGEGGSNDDGGPPKFMQPFENYLDKHIVVSEYLKKYLIRNYNNKASRISVIHNGVDTDFFKPCPQKIIKNVTWLGRFSPEKNPMLFAELASKNKSLEFTMAGDGPLLDLVKSYKHEKRIDNLHLLGRVDNSKKLLEQSLILVMTSKMEGLPIVLLEAGSMGKPVICPEVGGIPEYITKFNGYMYKTETELLSSFSKVIESKLTDPSLSTEIRQRVVSKFSLRLMINKYKKEISR